MGQPGTNVAARALGVAVTAVVGALLLAGCERSAPPGPDTTPVWVRPAEAFSEANRRSGASYLATVRVRDQVTLSFQVPGIVEMVGPLAGDDDWKEGAEVTRGRLLARLRQTDFREQVKAAEAQAALDGAHHERTRRLHAQGAASNQELERADAARKASESLLALRQQNLLDTEIIAPFDGTILKREVAAGETVAAGQPVVTLANLDEFEVEVGVPDRLVGGLRTNTMVRLKIAALHDAEFRGEVREVGVAAREGSRLFRVVVRVTDSDERLRPGMAASVEFSDERREPTGVLVPLSALVARGTNDLAVFVVTNGVASERAVETGDILESSIEITAHLAAGEWVVVSGVGLLHDGARVEPRVAGGVRGAVPAPGVPK